jgi:acyl-coenzyme A synthetase/AMP-(fatty) acid ligase
VIGVPDEIKGTALVGFVVLKGAAPFPAPAEDGGAPFAIRSAGPFDKPFERFATAAGGERVSPGNLAAELTAHVARRLGKPLAPKLVLMVDALPKTRSGKIVRGAIARAFQEQPPGDLSSIENPEALEAIAAQARRQPA